VESRRVVSRRAPVVVPVDAPVVVPAAALAPVPLTVPLGVIPLAPAEVVVSPVLLPLLLLHAPSAAKHTVVMMVDLKLMCICSSLHGRVIAGNTAPSVSCARSKRGPRGRARYVLAQRALASQCDHR
jgi:hypothetical protein